MINIGLKSWSKTQIWVTVLEQNIDMGHWHGSGIEKNMNMGEQNMDT